MQSDMQPAGERDTVVVTSRNLQGCQLEENLHNVQVSSVHQAMDTLHDSIRVETVVRGRHNVLNGEPGIVSAHICLKVFKNAIYLRVHGLHARVHVIGKAGASLIGGGGSSRRCSVSQGEMSMLKHDLAQMVRQLVVII